MDGPAANVGVRRAARFRAKVASSSCAIRASRSQRHPILVRRENKKKRLLHVVRFPAAARRSRHMVAVLIARWWTRRADKLVSFVRYDGFLMAPWNGHTQSHWVWVFPFNFIVHFGCFFISFYSVGYYIVLNHFLMHRKGKRWQYFDFCFPFYYYLSHCNSFVYKYFRGVC